MRRRHPHRPDARHPSTLVFLLAALLTCAVFVGCGSPVVGGIANTIGGGALPQSQSTLWKDLAQKRSGEADGEELLEEDGQIAYRSERGPNYFGRKTAPTTSRSPEQLAPSFTADGMCIHCNGRGFRFSMEGSTRDYVDCSGCGGDGRR